MPKRLQLRNAYKLAQNKSWKCISKEYLNNHTKMKWICKNNHIVHISLNNLQNTNNGCNICSKKKKHTIIELQNICNKLGGICLSKKYINSETLLKFKCKYNHKWKAKPANIFHGQWCLKCYRIKRRYINIHDINNKLVSKNIKCLSIKYKNNRSKLLFQCPYNHKWKASYDSVINRDSGCPECANSRNINENICRNIFEKLFNKKFKKVHPIWLRSNKNRRMELDGYNKLLKLAFEYNGIQHYEIDRFFNQDDKDKLNNTIERDELKRKICKEKEITLIEIPYLIDKKYLKEYIQNELMKYNLIKRP